MLRTFESSKPRWRKRRPARTADRAPDGAGGRALVCARCGHRVTDEAARTERSGLHEHSQVNPHGYIWCFGCFSRAPGCAPRGAPTTEFTWFSGYAWQLAHCRGCDLHLGWMFAGEGDRFWGLITERIVPEDEPS